MTGQERDRWGGTVWSYRGTCSSGKVGHSSRAKAKASAKLVKGHTMRPYYCDECGAWHVGHKPRAVVRGEVTADEWYAQRSDARRRNQPPHQRAGSHAESRPTQARQEQPPVH